MISLSRIFACAFMVGVLALPWASLSIPAVSAAELADEFAIPSDESSLDDEEEYVAPLDKEPISVSEAQYEALFKQSASRRTQSRSGISLKSVRIEWDEYDEFFPHLKLEVVLPTIPGYFHLVGPHEFHRYSQVIINNVKDRKGKDVRDAKSAFEKPPFTYLNYDYLDSAMDLFAAIHTIHIKKGVKEGAIASVDGKIRFDLPVEVKPTEFQLTEIGKKKTYGGTSMTLKSVEEGSVTVLYQGPTEQFVKMIGYDAQGKVLRWAERTGTFPDARKKPIEIYAAFPPEVKSVKLFVAKKVIVKQFPFVLKAPKK